MSASRPVLVVIGPSACGKSSVVAALHAQGLVRVHPTWTTRPRRPDEQSGALEHRFVCDNTFDRLEREGFFAATGAIAGLGYRYGLPPVVVGHDGPVDTVMLRAKHVARFRELVPDVLVYQIEDSARRAEARLRARGCSAEETSARLADNHREIVAGRGVAHRVFINDRPIAALAGAVAAVLRIDLQLPSGPQPATLLRPSVQIGVVA